MTISLALAPASALGVSPSSLSFLAQQGSSPAGQSLTITNTGGGTLTWTASEAISWLVGSPGTGSLAAGQSATMNLSVNSSTLAPGSYSGAITISATGATGSPHDIPVTLTVGAAPALGVSPSSLSFSAQQGSSPAGQSLTITNTGGGTLTWTASEAISWLVGSPGTGSLAAGQSATVNLSVNSSTLAPGSYSGTITISAPGATGSPQDIPVTLTVGAAPALGVSPSSLSFSAQQGSSPAGQSLTITNTGGGTLTWAASEAISWLVGSPGTGSLAAGQSATVNLTVNSSTLAPGSYSGAITISAPGATGSPQNIAISLSVASNLLAAPTLSSPGNGATGVSLSPGFNWSGVSGANRYWITVATSASTLPSDPNASRCAGCIIDANTSAPGFTPSTPLAAGTTYYWRVQGWNNGTTPYTQGQYSPVWSFTTTASTAAPTLLIDGSTSSSKAIGQTFTTTGSGYTPGRTVTRFLRDPSGNTIVLTPILNADGGGNIGWTFTSTCSTATGTYSLWIVDDATGRTSNTVTEIVTPSSTCSGGFHLTAFPLPNRTSTTAEINSVFDHSMVTPYCPDDRVVTFTGEEGKAVYGRQYVTAFSCGNLYEMKKSDGTGFVVNGHYTGGVYLAYDGHPGIDYRTTDQCPDATVTAICPLGVRGRLIVRAAAPGKVLSAGGAYGTIAIDVGGGYETLYLHLARYDVAPGATVVAGQQIGVSGETGAPGSPHLHFEVHYNGVPVDPYGWQGTGADPYTKAVNRNLW